MDVRDLRIRLFDGSDHVLDFVKRSHFDNGEWTSDEWGVAVKPASNRVMMHPKRPRPVDTDNPDRYVKELPDGRRVLRNVPGLRTVQFGELAGVLDRLVELRGDKFSLTVGELSQCIRL
jgi:hypothetical protein